MNESLQGTSGEGLVVPTHILGTKMEAAAYTITLAVSGSRLLPHIADIETRGILPEPVDVVNHVGNFSMTFLAANYLGHAYWNIGQSLATPEELTLRKKRAGIVIGALTVAANAWAEKYGYGPASTPDSLDFIYGCLAGFAAYKMSLPKFIKPATVETIEKQYPDSEAAKNIRRLRQVKKAGKSRVSAPSEQPANNLVTPRKKNGSNRKSYRRQQRQSRKRNR